MEVIIKSNYQELSKEAAEIIKEALLKKPNLVLGLATGDTPIGLYRELIRMHKEEGLDFSKVVTFNLDEYLGIPEDHEQSYHTFMRRHLFDHINIKPANIHIPITTAEKAEDFCQWYEEEIKRVGVIDIQVLGIGRGGHIGYNEPTSSLGSRTRIKTLVPETIKDNSRHFGGDISKVPKMAITMGVGTILEAKLCLLLASGSAKADAVAKCVEGPITAQVTASALQLHSKAVIIVDEEAASKLKRADYYKLAYQNKKTLMSQKQKRG